MTRFPCFRPPTLAIAAVLMAFSSACGDEEGRGAGRADEEAESTASARDAERDVGSEPGQLPRLIRLWSAGTPAFGIFASAGDTGEAGAEPSVDFVFLNLENEYSAEAVGTMADGLRSLTSSDPPSLLVRIPPISADGADATRMRVAQALALGAHGVVIPHVAGLGEARSVVSFFEEAGADVWSPSNPAGTRIAMMLLEDPEAVGQAGEIADLPGYSALACGIGSLTRALGGDRAAAEAMNQQVLAHAQRTARPDMIPATIDDVQARLDEGFLGILALGRNPGDVGAVIEAGRAAVGR